MSNQLPHSAEHSCHRCSCRSTCAATCHDGTSACHKHRDERDCVPSAVTPSPHANSKETPAREVQLGHTFRLVTSPIPAQAAVTGGKASLPLAPISTASALSRRVRRRSVNSSRCSLRWKEAPSAIAHGGHLNAEQDAKAAHALSTGIELEATKRWKKQVPHIGSMPLSVTQWQWAAFDLNSRRSI